jgi:branched-chain amino acid transport system permease protein
MHVLLLQILSGIANGGIYASVALALVMIYQSTHLVNFAQGEMAMFSTFVALTLLQAGLPYWATFIITLVVAFAGGVLVERIVLRPLGNAPVLSVVVVLIGLLVIFNSLAGWIFGYTVKNFPGMLPDKGFYSSTYLTSDQVSVIGVTLLELAAVFAFFRFTPLGLAMRAAAQNPVSARLVGIKVSWMLAFGWGLASAIGAVAGIMAAPILFLDPNMMMGVLLYGFAAALLGGIDNPWGAALGGPIVGVIENLVGATEAIGPGLKLTVALAIIVVVLSIRPAGLFGRKLTARV